MSWISLVPLLLIFRAEESLELSYDSFHGLELDQHLLMMASALVCVSGLDGLAHLGVDAHHPAVIGRKLKEAQVLKEKVNITLLFNLAPVVFTFPFFIGDRRFSHRSFLNLRIQKVLIDGG